MDHVFATVFPVFTLIALGYMAGRFHYVSESVSNGLSDFTFKLAVPAMLFRSMATAKLPDVAPLEVWAAFFGAVLSGWILATLACTTLLRRPVADSAPIAMSCGFGNVVMLGIPLSIGALGEQAAGPIALIVSVHTPILWTLATVHFTATSQAGSTSLSDTMRKLVHELSRNTIILAILAGTLWRLTGLGLHPIPETAISLLGQAAIPTALVALGLSLVGFEIKGQTRTLSLILALKLVVAPAVAWLLATQVFQLPRVAAGVIIIFAAMPTGANAFLFAHQSGRAMNSASGAVALGTILSVVTASAAIALITATVPH